MLVRHVRAPDCSMSCIFEMSSRARARFASPLARSAASFSRDRFRAALDAPDGCMIFSTAATSSSASTSPVPSGSMEWQRVVSVSPCAKSELAS